MLTNNTYIKTSTLNRETLDALLCSGNLEFLIAFNANGEIERFVPEGDCCDTNPLEFPIPAEQIEEIKQYHITKIKIKPQIASLRPCKTICTIGDLTWCCKYA